MKKKIITMSGYIATLLHNNGFFRGFKVLKKGIGVFLPIPFLLECVKDISPHN